MSRHKKQYSIAYHTIRLNRHPHRSLPSLVPGMFPEATLAQAILRPSPLSVPVPHIFRSINRAPRERVEPRPLLCIIDNTTVPLGPLSDDSMEVREANAID